MPLNAPKPLRKRLGIAMLAPRADLDAPADGIPGRVGPFDMRIQERGSLSWRALEIRILASSRRLSPIPSFTVCTSSLFFAGKGFKRQIGSFEGHPLQVPPFVLPEVLRAEIFCQRGL